MKKDGSGGHCFGFAGGIPFTTLKAWETNFYFEEWRIANKLTEEEIERDFPYQICADGVNWYNIKGKYTPEEVAKIHRKKYALQEAEQNYNIALAKGVTMQEHDELLKAFQL